MHPFWTNSIWMEPMQAHGKRTKSVNGTLRTLWEAFYILYDYARKEQIIVKNLGHPITFWHW